MAASLSVLGPKQHFFTQVGTVLFPATYSVVLLASLILVAVGGLLWVGAVRRHRRHRAAVVVTVLALTSTVLTAVEYTQYSSAVRANGGSMNPLSGFTALGGGAVPDASAVYSRRDGEDLTVSVYGQAPATGRKPVIVYVHGGGWNSGNAESASSLHRMMAEAGYLVFSINYLLSSPGHPGWDTQVLDVQAAMVWVSEHAADYGGDGSSIVLSGESAGGTLALVYSGRVAQGSLDGPAPKALSVMYPAIDLTWTSRHAQFMTPFVLPGIVEGYIGGSLQQYPDRLRAVSPLTYVNERMRPVLIIHGAKDTMVTIDGSREYAAALTEAGVPVRLAEIPYNNHGTAAAVNRDLTTAFLGPMGLAPR